VLAARLREAAGAGAPRFSYTTDESDDDALVTYRGAPPRKHKPSVLGGGGGGRAGGGGVLQRYSSPQKQGKGGDGKMKPEPKEIEDPYDFLFN
jgi:hypothetical protein